MIGMPGISARRSRKKCTKTALKLHTLSERARTSKGQKNFLDVVSLFSAGGVDPESVLGLLDEYGLSGSLKIFSELLSETKELPELGMNAHAYGRFRRKTTAWKNLQQKAP